MPLRKREKRVAANKVPSSGWPGSWLLSGHSPQGGGEAWTYELSVAPLPPKVPEVPAWLPETRSCHAPGRFSFRYFLSVTDPMCPSPATYVSPSRSPLHLESGLWCSKKSMLINAGQDA